MLRVFYSPLVPALQTPLLTRHLAPWEQRWQNWAFMIYPPSSRSRHRKLREVHCCPCLGMTGAGQKWYIGAINVPICNCDQFIRLGTGLSWTVAGELFAHHRQLSWLSNQGSKGSKHWLVCLFVSFDSPEYVLNYRCFFFNFFLNTGRMWSWPTDSEGDVSFVEVWGFWSVLDTSDLKTTPSIQMPQQQKPYISLIKGSN